MEKKTFEQLVSMHVGELSLEGVLSLPGDTKSVVLFAHGSGSSRHSPRNKFVAGVLQKANVGTLLFDLLSAEEDAVYENRFNIKLLADRLRTATDWVRKESGTKDFSVGYFGSSTGAAAALIAAADPEMKIGAVVSRGGRTDLAGEAIRRVQCPTRLIVGGFDDVVIRLNRETYSLLNAEKDLKIIPGATHLFEEPGALEEVADLAAEWFARYLIPASSRA
jgi:pimeloyl-ACP methyl ester carboxylesterase